MTVDVSFLDILNKNRTKGERNRQMILDAIIELKNPQPSDIMKYVNDKVKKEAQQKYELAEITGNEKRNYIKDNSMVIRTVLRHLSALTKEELVEHKDSRYSLPPWADIRSFANRFAYGVYHYVGDFPVKRPLEDNLAEFVNRIGAVILYTFIQAARPIEDDSISIAAKENLTLTWVQNAIPILNLYNLFLVYFAPDAMKDDPTNLFLYTASNDTIRRLMLTFSKLYPEIYKGLTEQVDYFVPGNKVKFIEKKKTGELVWASSLEDYNEK